MVAGSGVELDGDVLAADHAISLEPLVTELLGSALGSVRPLERHAVVVCVLVLVVDLLTADGHHLQLLHAVVTCLWSVRMFDSFAQSSQPI